MTIMKSDLHTTLNQIRIFTSTSEPTHRAPFFHDNNSIRVTKFLTDEHLNPLLSSRIQALCWQLHYHVKVNGNVWDYNHRQKLQRTFGMYLEELIRRVKELKLAEDVNDVEGMVEEVFEDWITVVGLRREKRKEEGTEGER